MLTDLYICDYIRKLDLRRILTDYGFKGDSLFYMCQFTILQAMRKEFNGTNPKHWNINKSFKNIEDFMIKNLINYFPGIVCFLSKTGESFIKVSSAYFYLTMFFLKMHMNTRFNLLTDISVVDNPEKRERLQLFYCILSLKFNARLVVLTSVNEASVVESISAFFSGANWYEREAWDMFGLFFAESPDLRRILTDYGFKGHPLLKEFPLTGFWEVHFDWFLARLLYQQTTFSQEYRVWSLPISYNQM